MESEQSTRENVSNHRFSFSFKKSNRHSSDVRICLIVHKGNCRYKLQMFWTYSQLQMLIDACKKNQCRCYYKKIFNSVFSHYISNFDPSFTDLGMSDIKHVKVLNLCGSTVQTFLGRRFNKMLWGEAYKSAVGQVVSCLRVPNRGDQNSEMLKTSNCHRYLAY